MDQWTRRIVGFCVHRGVVDGVALCQMFNRATRRQPPPKYLSSDHDPLFRFHQWQANLRILDVKAINRYRTHAGLGGLTPEAPTGEDRTLASVSKYRWQPHCRGR